MNSALPVLIACLLTPCPTTKEPSARYSLSTQASSIGLKATGSLSGFKPYDQLRVAKTH